MRAEVILMKCPETGKIYGVRTEERDGDWVRTWAFKISERTAANEGFDKAVIRGNLYADDEYNGCPYCKAVTFVQCGRCGKLSCWNSEEKMTCGWCGLTGNTKRLVDEINVSAGDI
jgi:hypothetical protein